MTFSYAGLPVPIPDGSDNAGLMPGDPVTASITVGSLTGVVSDVDLRIDGATCSTDANSTTVGISHPSVGDLRISLISPEGNLVIAINRPNGNNNIGDNYCQTLLDDESAGPSIQTVVTANNPFTGSFKPNSALSAFDGQNPNGKWTLVVQDFANLDIGTLRAFSIIIDTAAATTVPTTTVPTTTVPTTTIPSTTTTKATTTTTKPCTITGSGAITGTANADVICGSAEADSISGLGGNDTIRANGGNDTVTGGAGNDTISGGSGNDKISGDGGNDTMSGNDGADTLTGSSGTDTAIGGSGTDTCSAETVSSCP